MDCRTAQEKLPAYLEGALSAGEKVLVGEHLEACPDCRGALEELKKSGALVRGLEEAEPPAWLKQRVMARVREEAQKDAGFFRKLFYPLHIKVPAGVLATVLLAILAIQVFKTVEPTVEYPVQEPAAPAREVSREEAKVPPGKEAAPPAPAPRQGRARDNGDRGVAATDSAGEVKDEKAFSRKGTAEKDVTADKPGAPAKEKARAKMPEPFTAESAPPRAMEEKAASGAAARADREQQPALAASRVGKAVPAESGQVVLSLRAPDAAKAAGEVESILGRLGAKSVERKVTENAWSVTAVLEASNVPEFLEKLKSAGQVGGTAPAARRGIVSVRVEILEGP